jgi:Ca2+-binding EF-hand superfamily protein
MPAAQFAKTVTIEIERAKDCHSSNWHGWFDEKKYNQYEEKVRALLRNLAEPVEVEINPGPRSLGILCKQNEYNPKLWSSQVMDPDTRRWRMDQTFCYPRVGAFEIFVKKGDQRQEVFSKLKRRKWPNPDWLLAAIEDVVEKKLGGWAPLTSGPAPKPKRTYSGVDGKANATDEDLRQVMMKKHSTIVAAFRSFDKNGDGQINRSEFLLGLKQSGIDLPKEHANRLWEMADEDQSGVLHYTEFARKFANYKATHSLHRHAGLKSEADAKAVALHGVGAGARMAKTTQHRTEHSVSFAVAEGEHDVSPKSAPLSLSQLARTDLSQINVEQATVDQLRAKILQKHGNMVNAFRQMDNSGDSRICYEEFRNLVPKVLGEPLSDTKLKEFWAALDTDLTGEIDIDEFASGKLAGHKQTVQGVKVLRDMAVDPTSGMLADHQKGKENYSGLSNDAVVLERRPSKKLQRPDSASTVATESNSPEPKTVTFADSVA